MNCQEALALLYDIIDQEASDLDTQQVHEHLQKCQHCLKRYELEGDVNAFVKEKLSHSQPTQQLTSLRSKILCKLDTIDREGGGLTGHKPPFWRTSYLLAAAALLVVTIGAAYLVAGFYRHQDLYVPLEQAHWSARDAIQSYQDPVLTNTAFTYATDSLGYHLNSAVAGTQLVGGHFEEVDGVRMAHFVYANPGAKVVSVFVVPASNFQIPENLKDARSQRHGIDFFDHNCRGCRLVYHQVGNVVIVTATTDHSTELLDFIPENSSI